MNLKQLDDKTLVFNLQNKVRLEPKTGLDIIEYIEEVFRRRLFSDYHCKSINAFCIKILGYSPAEAARKINACRLIQDIPEAKKMIGTGDINQTIASNFQSFINNENKYRTNPIAITEKKTILNELKGKSCNEAERLLAEKSQAPQKPTHETKKKIKNNRVSIHFTMDESEYEQLTEKMEEFGASSIEELFIKMRKALDTKKEIRKYSKKKPDNIKSRNVPAMVKRKVFARDKNKCVICGSKRNLELDHITPISVGGLTVESNLRITCKFCNTRNAIVFLGQNKMNRFINR
ncbi:MAG: HNH endonuclease [Bacteriovoracaceae bacterium]|nr:HNH endonuclease [Bacteriovoracaceae bacterium]